MGSSCEKIDWSWLCGRCDEVKARLLIGASHLLLIEEVKNAETGAYLNGATLSARVLDVQRNEVASGITVTFTGNDGRYKTYLSHDLPLVPDKTYFIELDINAGSNLKRKPLIEVVADLDVL